MLFLDEENDSGTISFLSLEFLFFLVDYFKMTFNVGVLCERGANALEYIGRYSMPAMYKTDEVALRMIQLCILVYFHSYSRIRQH